MSETNKTNNVLMPTIAMRGLVLFPKMILQFDVGRKKSINALETAMKQDRKIFLTAQKDISTDEPTGDDVYRVGVVAKISQMIKSDADTVRVIVKGEYRSKAIAILDEEYLKAVCFEFPLKEIEENETLIEANMRIVKELFEEYCLISPKMPKELVLKVLTTEDPVFISQFISENLPLKVESKQQLLEESDVMKRLALIENILKEENEIASIENDIYDRVKGQIDQNQRNYYLKEQLKAITDELGNNEEDENNYVNKINTLPIEDKYKTKLLKDNERMERLPSNSNEYAVIQTHIESVLSLPWKKKTKDKIDIEKAEKQLNKDHFGLKDVKERVLENLAVRVFEPNIKGQILCLVGPPGVGKTSIAKSIAKAMNRKYARISLGGVRDESDIRGHKKTYVGAMEGRIISAIRTADSINPVILLDEIDKMGNDFRGDPSSAMLEVLDSEQNSTFTDHFIEVPFDLSKVLFIATANDLSEVPRPLLDRMEVISLGSYTREEKFNIAKKHLVSKELKNYGLTSKKVKFNQKSIYHIIDGYTREAGVRTLSRTIASVIRKSAKDLVTNEQESITLTPSLIENYLGPVKFKEENDENENLVGVVNGLAWTSVGGEILKVEVAVLEGSGKIELTGLLGDVMKESAKTAVTYVRSCYKKYSIDKDFYKTKDIHIHFPEGAVPKDGPSAGVTIVTALVSALTDTPVKHDVAMTGEVTLRGRVLPIGGLKEKTMAAYTHNVKTIVIPYENKSDLFYCDDVVKENIKFVYAKNVQTAIDTALDFKILEIEKEPKMFEYNNSILTTDEIKEEKTTENQQC